jgi:hypothetical protein
MGCFNLRSIRSRPMIATSPNHTSYLKQLATEHKQDSHILSAAAV